MSFQGRFQSPSLLLSLPPPHSSLSSPVSSLSFSGTKSRRGFFVSSLANSPQLESKWGSFGENSCGRKGLNAQNINLVRKKIKLVEKRENVGFTLGFKKRIRVGCEAANGGENVGEGEKKSNLGLAIRRKQATIQARLLALGDVDVESYVSASPGVTHPQTLMDLLATRVVEGRTAVIAEVARLSPAEDSEKLVDRCREYVEWGADAIFLCCDEEQTPDGFSDLKIACQGLSVPVIRKDWILHPLQISETAGLGAAGINLIPAILGKGTLPLVQFALSLGLDAIVEVVNYKEVEEMAQFAVPLYGVNLSIGLSIAIPGARQSVASSIVKNLPFGAASIVGISSIEEGRNLRDSGATAVLVRREALQGLTEKDSKTINAKIFLQELNYAMTGDD